MLLLRIFVNLIFDLNIGAAKRLFVSFGMKGQVQNAPPGPSNSTSSMACPSSASPPSVRTELLVSLPFTYTTQLFESTSGGHEPAKNIFLVFHQLTLLFPAMF